VKQVSFAPRLRLLERGLGVPEQRLGVGTVIREYRYSTPGGDPEYAVSQVERVLKKNPDHFFEHPRQIASLPDFRQHHGKDVRAHSRNKVGISRGACQPLRHLPQ
jgi:hypothetical protein